MNIFDGLIANALGGNGGGGGGGGSAPLMVHITEDGSLWTLDKTWNEIKSAMESGIAYAVAPEGYSFDLHMLIEIRNDDSTYYVSYFDNGGGQMLNFHTNDADDYPYYSFD